MEEMLMSGLKSEAMHGCSRVSRLHPLLEPATPWEISVEKKSRER
jgi:hypothetical protein